MKDERERAMAVICGRKIKQLREREGYSQGELAEYLDCSDESIGKVERGIQSMKLWRLRRLCDLFHVSLDYLVSEVEPSDLSVVPSYVIKLFHDADELEYEILSDHMLSASHAIDIVRSLRRE